MLLEMKNITKQFPGVKALDDVSLTLDKGEVVAICGENGAGKSTLIKVLSGAYTPNNGEIFINDKKQSGMNPISSIKNGIGVIYQELNSVDQLSVAENIFIGNLPKNKANMVDYKQLKKDSKVLLDKVGLNVNPFETMENLSIAEKQLVEIAKIGRAHV